MGVSRLSAYEIAGNPDDIVTGSYKDDESGKYGGIISRGPGHHYKLIVSTNAGYASQEEAKADMDRIVSHIVQTVKKELGI